MMIPYIHVKTGKVYYAEKMLVVNCTNNCADQLMVMYKLYPSDETIFVREVNEFKEKFKPV